MSKEQVWKNLPEIDAQIRTIEPPSKGQPDWIVKVGLFESLGEQGGDIIVHLYDKKPVEQEIIDDTKIDLLNIKEYLAGTMMSGREEKQYEVLLKIFPCDHLDSDGNLTFEKEDDRCDTDRGTYGSIWARCTQCDADISDEVLNAKEVARENLHSE